MLRWLYVLQNCHLDAVFVVCYYNVVGGGERYD